MAPGETSSNPEQYTTADQINTLYNLALSLQSFSRLGARWSHREPAMPPDEVFSDALPATAASDFKFSGTVMSDEVRLLMVPDLTEKYGADQAAPARIWFDRTDRGTADGITREAFVTYKILEQPSDDINNPEPIRQLLKSTTETTGTSPEARSTANLAEFRAAKKNEDGIVIKEGTVNDRDEIFTPVRETEAQALIEYMTDAGVTEAARYQQGPPPPDFFDGLGQIAR